MNEIKDELRVDTLESGVTLITYFDGKVPDNCIYRKIYDEQEIEDILNSVLELCEKSGLKKQFVDVINNKGAVLGFESV